jgi:hypothetical protein
MATSTAVQTMGTITVGMEPPAQAALQGRVTITMGMMALAVEVLEVLEAVALAALLVAAAAPAAVAMMVALINLTAMGGVYASR